jgi:diguanylate cyclase (GGDEF)-like protein
VTTSPPRLRRFRLVLLGHLVLFVAGLVLAVPGFTRAPALTAPATLLRDGFGVAAGLMCLLRVALVRGERAPWAVLGAGLVCYGTATSYFDAAVGRPGDPPGPSLADVGWLAFYPAYYATVIMLLRRRVVRFQRSLLLDTLVGVLGVAAVAGALGTFIPRENPDASRGAVLVNLVYPLADLLLVLLVASVFGLLGWRPGRAWWLLGSGAVGLAAADTTAAVSSGTDRYPQGGPLNVLWALSLLMPALAAWQHRPPKPPARMPGWGVIAVPGVLTLLGLALLVFAATVTMPLVVVILAAAAVLTAPIRAAIMFVEVQRLATAKVMTLTDDLTGLTNRRGFLERLARAERAAAAGASFALLLLDLDRFKEINYSLGHPCGDRLLARVGGRISTTLRSGDLLARLGADEFAVLLARADIDTARLVADRMLAALSSPFDVDGVTLHMTASIGAAVFPDHATDANTLLQRADVAMYAAKSRRTGVEYYRPGLDANTLVRFDMIESLRNALGSGQLEVYYQMKVDLGSGRADAVEALVRWQHPTRGLLSPEEFVPLAEQTGLMRELTVEVLDIALAQCRRWRDDGLDVGVAVNLSASDLLDRTFPDQVRSLLAAHRLPATALELEITETTLMRDLVRPAELLGELRELGIRIAVDDYGTGYSSLAYLRELPVDVLKLDKSFIRHLDTDRLATEIVRSTVGLAHALGLRIVVEGVETASAMRQLEDFGCDYAQGYFLGNPQPADRVTALLRQHQNGRPATTRAAGGGVVEPDREPVESRGEGRPDRAAANAWR